VFRVVLPNGGDGQPLSTYVSYMGHVVFKLLPGILRNPAAGDYAIHAVFTSVDPDTDGATNGTGAEPLTFAADRTLTIACPAGTTCAAPPPAAGACVTDADCVDDDPCTSDTCAAGACSHAAGAALDQLDCELEELLAPQLCGSDPIDAAVQR